MQFIFIVDLLLTVYNYYIITYKDSIEAQK